LRESWTASSRSLSSGAHSRDPLAPRNDGATTFSRAVHCSIVPAIDEYTEETMRTIFGRLAGTLLALLLTSGLAAAQSKITIAVGGGSCLCYLPTVLAKQLGEFDKAGLSVELVDLKGGSDALKAVLGGSADVVSGYFDHCVNLAARKQELVAFVVYDRYPGLVLVVSPSHASEIKSIKDLAGKKVGVSAPGSSTDFFLKYLLKKNGLDPVGASVIGVGLGATSVAAMEQGQIDAAVMLDPSVTVLQGSHPDLRILSDTRTQKDTLAVFGGEYPGGALYSTAAWVTSHEKEVQALTNAILNTLAWIHSHSPEDIMAKMPAEIVGKDKALYLAALKNTIPMYSENGRMDPKGADAVLAVFSESSPEVAKAHVDVSKTYTNKFVEQAKTAGNAK
jgi:NitT/TauT family transport system substrate-binding protein